MDDIKLTADSKKERELIIEFAKKNNIYFEVIHYPETDYEETLEKVFKGLKDESFDKRHDRWWDYLKEKLDFPFEAVIESSENLLVRHSFLDIYNDETVITKEDFENKLKSINQELHVKSMSGCDDLRGIIVEVKHGRKKYHYPLCSLEPVDYDTENWELIRAYNSWFSEM